MLNRARAGMNEYVPAGMRRRDARASLWLAREDNLLPAPGAAGDVLICRCVSAAGASRIQSTVFLGAYVHADDNAHIRILRFACQVRRKWRSLSAANWQLFSCTVINGNSMVGRMVYGCFGRQDVWATKMKNSHRARVM